MNAAKTLEIALSASAIAQLIIATLNLLLVRVMRWQDEVQKMPLLVREVFHVHGFFVSVTLAIFSTLTLRFASDVARAANPLCVWLAASIGIFWAMRAVMQWTYYSSIHWRGDRARTCVHWALTIIYGGFSVTYLAAVF